ncbi:unnamed protein product [Sphenostylis stenocarpa]|uniref:Uncharacterized protein n=1 Tax=Sphenostylis stenocarpa TaxID=92480 RepID=A0AA86T1D7_9FABA|nr:unnamed protein product [Sphenostylis stenocarpa]
MRCTALVAGFNSWNYLFPKFKSSFYRWDKTQREKLTLQAKKEEKKPMIKVVFVCE